MSISISLFYIFSPWSSAHNAGQLTHYRLFQKQWGLASQVSQVHVKSDNNFSLLLFRLVVLLLSFTLSAHFSLKVSSPLTSLHCIPHPHITVEPAQCVERKSWK